MKTLPSVSFCALLVRIFSSQMERASSVTGPVARWLFRSKLCRPNFIRCSTQRNNVKNRVCVRYLVLLTVTSKLSWGSRGYGVGKEKWEGELALASHKFEYIPFSPLR